MSCALDCRIAGPKPIPSIRCPLAGLLQSLRVKAGDLLNLRHQSLGIAQQKIPCLSALVELGFHDAGGNSYDLARTLHDRSAGRNPPPMNDEMPTTPSLPTIATSATSPSLVPYISATIG